MATTINTAGQWFYERDSEVLFINEDEKKVGILTQTPEYELDVNGTIRAITYCNLPPFALSNNIYQLANTTSNVAYTTSNVAYPTSNVAYYASNNMVVNGNIVTVSNLNILDTLKRNGSNIVDTDGKIDYTKWLKNTPIQEDEDGNIIIPIPVITYINTVINNNIGGGGGDGEDHDPGYNDDSIYVHWNNVIHAPIYKNINDLRIGFGSNIYVENKSKIYGIDKVELLSYDGGKFKRISTNLVSDDLWYDFETKRMYLNQIDCTSNIVSSNLSASNALIQTISATAITAPIISCSNLETVNVISTALISASNIYSSNVDTRNLTCVQATFSNLTAFSNISSSNVSSSNIYSSNLDTRVFTTVLANASNISTSNVSTNFLQATSVNSQTSIITTMTATTLSASNVSACNVKQLNDDFYTFSNMSWKFNGSNIWHGSNEFHIAIGKSNATEKLDVVGNIKASGGGSFANNNFVISSNLANPHCLTINNSNIFRTDGNIGNHFLTHLNNIAGNQSFVGTAGDTYNPQTQSSNLLTNYNSVIWKPTYHDANFNLGFSSNVFFNRFSQLCTTEPSWDYTKTSNGMYKTFNAPFVRSNVVIDFNTYTATLCNVITSNATINFNLTTSNIRTSNLSTSNITTSNVYGFNANLSNLWASNVGINQINPLYNLDVNGGTRIQGNLLVNSNITCGCNLTVGSNLGVGTTSPAYILDVNGATAIRNGNANVGWSKSQLLLGFNNTNTYQHTINTRHNVGGGNMNSIDFLLWDSNVLSTAIGDTNSMSITASGVGIFNSNPSYRLDVSGNARLNNTFVGDVGWGASFASVAHSNCISTTNYALLQQNDGTTYLNCATGKSIIFRINNQDQMRIIGGNVGIGTSSPSYKLDVHGGATRCSNGLLISGANVLEFGQGVSGKEGNAGKIGYETYTTGALDIIGAGASGAIRNVKIWDDLTVGNSLKVGGGDFFKGFKIITQKVSDNMGFLVSETFTITHNLNNTLTECFFTFRDTNNPNIEDAFTARVTGRTANTITVRVRRCDAIGWATGPTMICLFISV